MLLSLSWSRCERRRRRERKEEKKKEVEEGSSLSLLIHYLYYDFQWCQKGGEKKAPCEETAAPSFLLHFCPAGNWKKVGRVRKYTHLVGLLPLFNQPSW